MLKYVAGSFMMGKTDYQRINGKEEWDKSPY